MTSDAPREPHGEPRVVVCAADTHMSHVAIAQVNSNSTAPIPLVASRFVIELVSIINTDDVDTCKTSKRVFVENRQFIGIGHSQLGVRSLNNVRPI